LIIIIIIIIVIHYVLPVLWMTSCSSIIGQAKVQEVGRQLKVSHRRAADVSVLLCDAGAVVGYATVDNYDSMMTVLRAMSDEDKKRLVERVQELVGSSSLEALTSFIASQVNRELFAATVREFAAHVKRGG